MDPLSEGLPGADERAEAEALLLLQRVLGLGDRSVRALVEGFGSGRAALAAGDRDAAAAIGRGEEGRRAVRARGGRPDRDAVAASLAAADALAMRVVPMTSPRYPARLLELSDPPPVLFLRGRSELLLPPAVAIVGSRRATAYGRRVAARLAAALAREGVVVVSGLALGVDGEAHRGALDAGGPTVAVLGTGADAAHPPAHAGIFRRIAQEGLLVSEFPPGTPALAHHFPRRNRIMAALARVVVVVEAAARSGALITARHALDLGRDVLAVPGPIDADTSAGTNALLRDGAQPMLGPDDVLRALGIEAAGRAPVAPPRGTDLATLWDALGAAPLGVDELSGRTGFSAPRALAALSQLEVEGWAVQTAGARFARRA